MTDTPLRLLACQINIPAITTVSERDAHLDMSSRKVRSALQNAPADLVVLPELSSIDYSRATFDCLDAVGEPLKGASFECWRQVAREFNCHVAYSFARQDAGAYYICLAVVGPAGQLVGHYDKLHLAQYGASMEKEYFQRGDHLFTFQVGDLTFAPIICYDLRIPELTRTLVLEHDADVILHCGAYFRDTSFATWHDFATTRALENQVYFLSLNRAGADYGKSRFCYPWMDENKQAVAFAEYEEEFKLLEITMQEITKARKTYSFLNDRLPDYKNLKR